MAETKFTPGPWRCVRAGFNEDGTVRYTLEGVTQARIYDAHLIAAAPEMYELLTVIMANAEIIPDPRMGGATECYAVPLDDIEGIRALLSKARGEQTNKEN